MKRLSFFFILLCTCINLYSESDRVYRLSGVVTEEDNIFPLPYTTIQIFKQEDLVNPIKACVSDSVGYFKIALDAPGSYVLAFNYLGKKPLNKSIELSDVFEVDLGSINIDDYVSLNEVVVSAPKILIKTHIDRIEYNVDNDPEAKASNLQVIMEKVPILVLSDNTFLIKGSVAPKYLVNGKPSSLFNKDPLKVLKSIPSNTISRIEVITNPGAKYDAEDGGGIINIVMKKQQSGNITGSATVSADTRGGIDGSVSVGAQVKHVSFSALYSYSEGGQFFKEEEIDRINKKDDVNYRLDQSGISRNRMDRTNSLLFESSWDPDTLNIVNLSVNYFNNRFRQKGENSSFMSSRSNSQIYSFKSDNDSYFSWGNLNISADYQKKLLRNHGTVSLLYKYSNMPVKSEDVFIFSERNNYDAPSYRNRLQVASQEHTFQLDYEKRWRKISTLNAGAKYIIRTNSNLSDYAVRAMNEPIWQEVSSPEDDFVHRQDVLAFYIDYELNWKNLTLKAGIREEITHGTVKFSTDTSLDFQSDFNNLLPSALVSYKLNSSDLIKFSYNNRVYRPNISYLNPKKIYNTPNSAYYGNPTIDSESFHTWGLEFSHTALRFSANLQVNHDRCNNLIQSYSYIGTDNIYYTTYNNSGHSKSSGASAFCSWQPANFMRLGVNGTLSYVSIDSQIGNEQVENSGWTGTVSANVGVTFPLGLYFTVNGGYNFPQIRLQGSYFNFYYAGCRLSKSFCKERLTVGLAGRSILWNKRQYKSYFETNEFLINTRIANPGMTYTLSIAYNFNSFSPSLKKTSKKVNNDDLKGNSAGAQ